MSANPLGILKAKVNRTKAQIQNLDEAVRSFVSTNSYEIVSDLNFDGTERIWRFVLTNSDTSDLAVMAGEIIHNLRSALDNIACAVAEKHCGRTDRTYFPFGKDVDIFETQLRLKGKDLPDDAIAMIRALKPYAGGNELLWALHNLNRYDKHPGINTAQPAQGSRMRGLKVYSGRALIFGNRNGQHLIVDGYIPKVSAIAVQKEGEFLTTTPFAQFEYDGEPIFQISFNEVRGFEREPIVAVLHQMRDLVDGVLLAFQKRFF